MNFWAGGASDGVMDRWTRMGKAPRTLESVDADDYSTISARPAELPERELVRHAQAGDGDAFARLVDRYGPMVLSLAYSSTLNEADAEDVAQETFLVAWRSLAAFRGDAQFSTWLYGLARSRCVDRARRARVRPAVARHTDQDEMATDAGSGEARTAALAVLSAAAELPLPQRQAVLMRDVQGLSYEEIAVLQDVRVGTVRSRIAVARCLIANRVGEL